MRRRSDSLVIGLVIVLLIIFVGVLLTSGGSIFPSGPDASQKTNEAVVTRIILKETQDTFSTRSAIQTAQQKALTLTAIVRLTGAFAIPNFPTDTVQASPGTPLPTVPTATPSLTVSPDAEQRIGTAVDERLFERQTLTATAGFQLTIDANVNRLWTATARAFAGSATPGPTATPLPPIETVISQRLADQQTQTATAVYQASVIAGINQALTGTAVAQIGSPSPTLSPTPTEPIETAISRKLADQQTQTATAAYQATINAGINAALTGTALAQIGSPSPTLSPTPSQPIETAISQRLADQQTQTATAAYQAAINAGVNQALTATALAQIGSPSPTPTPPPVETLAFQQLADQQTQTATAAYQASIKAGVNQLLTATAQAAQAALTAGLAPITTDNVTALMSLAVLQGHSKSVVSVTFSPNGLNVASGSLDNAVRLWNAQSGAPLGVFKGFNPRQGVAFSPDGSRLAFSGADTTVRIWDLRAGVEVAVLRGHTGDVASIAFSPDGTLLVSGSADRSVRLWNVQSGNLVTVLKGHTDSVLSVAFSPDGRRVASASADKTIRLWDVQAQIPLAVLRGHSGAVTSVAFSPDGTRIASASTDTNVRLWDAENGTPLLTLKGHVGAVTSVAFSPDGTLLASGGVDKSVRLWNAATGDPLVILKGHTDSVLGVAFSPDGVHLASASADTTLRLWGIRSNP